MTAPNTENGHFNNFILSLSPKNLLAGSMFSLGGSMRVRP